jgi:pimeloyl-ACP methyl ester carboxylesterase
MNSPDSTKCLSHIAMVILLGIFAIAFSGCFQGLRKDTAMFENGAVAAGRIRGMSSEDAPITVIAYREEDQKMRIYAFTNAVDDKFYFILAGDRDYYFVGFEDTNNNRVVDDWELAGAVGSPDPTRLAKGERKEMRLTLDEDFQLQPRYPRDIDAAPTKLDPNIPVVAGKVVTFDDSILSAEVGKAGLWEPWATVKKHGVGIYFLEPYDPNRIPVVFVHGAGGSPQGFKSFVDNLDRKRYQIWLYRYPSGVRIIRASRALATLLDTLHRRYQFEELAVVAHSMGGLVARGALLLSEQATEYVNLFISISTPWNGHELAKTGVRSAPAVIPSWIDMQSNSDYIKEVFAYSLPDKIDYYLIFGFGSTKSVKGRSSDGSVTLASQLDRRIQARAKRIFGLEYGHVDILYSGETFEIVRGLLDGDMRVILEEEAALPEANETK